MSFCSCSCGCYPHDPVAKIPLNWKTVPGFLPSRFIQINFLARLSLLLGLSKEYAEVWVWPEHPHKLDDVPGPRTDLAAYITSKAAGCHWVGSRDFDRSHAWGGRECCLAWTGQIRSGVEWGVQPDGSQPLFDRAIEKQDVKLCGRSDYVAHMEYILLRCQSGGPVHQWTNV